jgi:hypothetical protein
MTRDVTSDERVFLLDTTALLAHYRKERGFQEVQNILEDDSAVVLMSALSVAEFARRMLTLGADRDEARQAALDYAGLADEVVAIDTSISVRAFELGTLTSERLPLIDALIAASALSRGAVLVHRDSHFTSIGVQLMAQRFLGA